MILTAFTLRPTAFASCSSVPVQCPSPVLQDINLYFAPWIAVFGVRLFIFLNWPTVKQTFIKPMVFFAVVLFLHFNFPFRTQSKTVDL